MSITAKDILCGLVALSESRIWASELAFFNGQRRIDFWTLEPTPSAGFRASAYEIKISRADFARDNEEKQGPALKYSDRFWYVTPPGLIKARELPEWAGLQEFDGQGFKVIRRAPKREKIEPDWYFIVNLLRNSGDNRRDVSILKQQLASYRFAYERSEQEREVRQKVQFRRWMDKSLHGSAANPTTSTPEG